MPDFRSFSMPTEPHYRAGDLSAFATALFEKAGCEAEKASSMAEHLVEADLMGHTTHGLAQAGAYLEELESGAMARTGEPELIADRPAAVTWDGGFLPGVWLARKALDLAAERASRLGIAAVSIRRSHHIGCLSVHLRQATERQLMCIVACSDPSDATMAPFGGTKPVFTPDPIAIGIPTKGDPIMVDISSSITTNAMTGRLKREGKRFPGKWALDAAGQPTDDPAALSAGGTLLPTGGHDHGHKGYGLALAVEAMTQGLSGYGRAERPTIWGANVYVQVMDPAAFGGVENYLRETSWVAELCRQSPAPAGQANVRLPGEQASQRRRKGLTEGLSLYSGIMPGLRGWADKLKVALPEPI
jgi:LDH2 family malate/lactate/ureidoglycolate dehydrogenase